MSRLVLLRHGESVWNRENRFSGWADVELTDQGDREAREAGKILRTCGFQFNRAHTSLLKRAILTLWIVQDEMDAMWMPTYKSWRLNERHYGALQGFVKSEMAARIGKERVFAWRRTFSGRPPELMRGDPRHPRYDQRYQDIPPNQLPGSESLEDTLLRVLPYWQEEISRDLISGQDVLVVAHGNSLRALVTYLNQIPEDQVPDLQIPTGLPLVYEFNQEMQVARSYYLNNPNQEQSMPIEAFFSDARQKP
jgi:2,3-bisphosphoglycerate-dependent phosphoglycerate mutase